MMETVAVFAPPSDFCERGTKVKQVYTDNTGSLTTYYYAGGSFEVQTDGSTETVRQYYAIAGVTAGMREGSTFSYFLTDHLVAVAAHPSCLCERWSVVGVTDSTGTLTSETRYLPFGEIYTDVGTISQTDYGFTFQKNLPDMGLMDYKARAFDPLLGRFIQPDTIIPGAGNPQAYNRYSYTTNNPVKYIDPSGHMAQVDDGGSCIGHLDCIKKPIKPKKPTPPSSSTSDSSTIEQGINLLQYSKIGQDLYNRLLNEYPDLEIIYSDDKNSYGVNPITQEMKINKTYAPARIAGTIAHEAYHQFSPGDSLLEEYGAFFTGDIVRNDIIQSGYGVPSDMFFPIKDFNINIWNPNRAELSLQLIDWFDSHNLGIYPKDKSEGGYGVPPLPFSQFQTRFQ
jgi:RHS repeat-associated protein